MKFHKTHIAIMLAVVLTYSASIRASQKRWINAAGGMTSNEANWYLPGNPDGDDLLFNVTGLGTDTYTVYVDGPGPDGLLQCGSLRIEDDVTFDLLGGGLEVGSELYVGKGGGGGGITLPRSLTLTNNTPQRASALSCLKILIDVSDSTPRPLLSWSIIYGQEIHCSAFGARTDSAVGHR